MAVGAQAFDLRQILLSMSKINWEVKEVMSQHNTYIDLILRVITQCRLIIVISCVLLTRKCRFSPCAWKKWP